MDIMKVPGLAELDKALAELSEPVAKNALRRVGRRALEPFVERARQMAPMDEPGDTPKRPPGTLKYSYHTGTRLNKRQARTAKREGKSYVEVYAGTNDRAAVLVEFGTAHHGAQPHARPAWEATQGLALGIIKTNLGEEIDKSAQRVMRKRLKAQGVI